MTAANKQSASRRMRRWGILVVSLLVVVGLVTASVWAYRAHGKQKLIEAIKQDPSKIREARESGALTRQEVRDAMEQAFEQRMNKELDGYFALGDAKSRQAYLDRLIDEQQARARERQPRAATQPARERPTTGPSTRPWDRDRGGDQAQRMRERYATGDPARKAQRAEFRAAMMKRMQERGIQPGRGGFGGGFGGPGGGGRGRG